MVERLLAVRIEHVHDLGAPAEHAHRQPAADELAEEGQVRRQAVELGGAAVGEAQHQAVVEHEQRAGALRGLLHAPQEAGRRGRHEAAEQQRLEHDGGDLLAVLGELALERLGVAERREVDAAGLLRAVVEPDLEVVEGAVEAVDRLQHRAAPGERARDFHREHPRLGARVGEAHALEDLDPLAQHPRELDLLLGRDEEARAAPGRLAQRRDDGWERVAVDQAEPVVREVDVAVVVEVDQVRAFAAPRDERVRPVVAPAARQAAHHVAPRALHRLGRARRALAVALLDARARIGLQGQLGHRSRLYIERSI